MVNYFNYCNMQKKYLFLTFFTISDIFLVIIFFTGCTYGQIVNLSEQVAIYQNMGFYKYTNNEHVNIENISININYLDDINQDLAVNNQDYSLQELTILIKPTEDKIEGLLFIYRFNNQDNANKFCKFYHISANNYYIISNYVIQKGLASNILSQAQNTYYFNNFYKSIKK